MDMIYLDSQTWDLALDASGNIALCTKPFALALAASCACRTFIGECWYDTTIGVPYWQDILGLAPPLQLLKQYLIDAALTVPGIVDAQVYITQVGRAISGQVQVTDTAGNLSAANF